MNEAQKICVAKREFADALYSSNVFPMWSGRETTMEQLHASESA